MRTAPATAAASGLVPGARIILVQASCVMINDAVTAGRAAVNAINDRSLGDRVTDLLDPSFIRYDLAQLFSDSHGPGGAADFVSMIISAMPDFRLTIEDFFGTGDRAVVRLHMSGTHTRAPLLGQPASGRALSASAVFIYRMPAAASPRPGSWWTASPSTASLG